MQRLTWALPLMLMFAACEPAPPDAPAAESVREVLLDTDRRFADRASRQGLEGWMSFFADDAARLELGGTFADSTIVQGKPAIRAFDAGLFADPAFLLSWEPADAGVFADGRSGFTTGNYAFIRRDPVVDTLGTGHYVTIWRREPDGDWRVVLDTGSRNP